MIMAFIRVAGHPKIFNPSVLFSTFIIIIIMAKRPNPESSTEPKNTNQKLTDLMPIGPPMKTAPTPDEIQWITNKTSYYPFSEATGLDMVEFRVHGTVMEPFLKGGPGAYSHTVSIDLSNENVALIKSYVYKIPNYDPAVYRWPIEVNAVKFTSKEKVSLPFSEVWEISDEKLICNEHLRSPISWERVKKGTPVWVEYTIVGYSGKAATEEDSNKFDPGVTLRLLSISMLSGMESRYNFGSIKRRRAAC